MSVNILDGKKYAKEILYNIKSFVVIKIESGVRSPCLAIILIGNDMSSKIYIKNKIIACNVVGFLVKLFKFKKCTNENIIIKLLNELNYNKNIDGIIIQFPIPNNFNLTRLVSNIIPSKDVDLLNPISFGNYILGYNKYILPCTPNSILYLLNKTSKNLNGLTAVLIGSSNIVGKPLIYELLSYNINVIVLSENSSNFNNYLNLADILIVAAGKINLINGKYLKHDVIIIDVGINRLTNGKIVGDINFNDVKNKCSFITPVPGGVGPLTVAKLLENVLRLYILNIC